MQLHISSIKQFLANSLAEDLGQGGDITSKFLISANKNIDFSISARQNLVLCGTAIVEYFFNEYSSVKCNFLHKDGDIIDSQSSIIEGKGNALEVLALERTILNYLQHLSAVATLTKSYVDIVKDNKAKICDTRKTIPGLRLLQKYAVTCGGGNNHRFALDSSILIKDNHIAACGGVKQAMELAKARAPHYTKIEIECDNLEQVKEAVAYKADIIMLDNMTIANIKSALNIINNTALIEVSGGINLDNILEIARTGVDLISIGKLTNSAPAVDIGLDII